MTVNNFAQLRESIAQRKVFLEKVLVFCQEIVSKHGRVAWQEQGSDYTVIDRYLEDFDGFTIYWGIGRTSNRIEIKRYVCDKYVSVFIMVYQGDGIDNCQVHDFAECDRWVPLFTKTMDTAETILALKQAEQARQVETSREELFRRQEENQLLEEARRLKLM